MGFAKKPKQFNYFCFYDFETGARSPETAHPLQIAAIIVDNKTLEPVDGGKFNSYMRPPISDDEIMDPSIIEEGALAVNHIKREDIKNFIDEKTVWTNFIEWMKSYRIGNKNWGNPIRVGQNILRYDDIIVSRLCERYNTPNPFHPRDFIDTLNLSFLWLEGSTEIDQYGFDFIRRHVELPIPEGELLTHDALRDSMDGVVYFTRFLRFMRGLAKRRNYFKGAFND